MKAILILEDESIFEGCSFGAKGEKIGKVVFHTGVVGYQELITDPSYRGLLLTMTYPLIGNYGINEAGYESEAAQAEALIVKENSRIHSNWLAQESLEDFMKRNNVVGIEGIDTRALVVHLRDNGEMTGVVSTQDFKIKNLIKKAKAFSDQERDLISEVTISKVAVDKPPERIGYKVVVIDLGGTKSLFNSLRNAGCQIIRVPARTSAGGILRLNPDGIVLSSGPEDLKGFTQTAGEVRNLLGEKPVLGISSGNLVLAMALGGEIRKMKCGHHGVNQPVRNLETRKVAITVQNHSCVVSEGSAKKTDIEVTERNLNDQSIEGIKSKSYPAIGLQYVPADFNMFFAQMEKELCPKEQI